MTSPSMDEGKAELLPCPFCGGDATEIASPGFPAAVYCETDDCVQNGIARTTWNKRASPAPQAGVPREPTTEMNRAGWAAIHHHTNGANHLLAGGLYAAWTAMYDAAIGGTNG